MKQKDRATLKENDLYSATQPYLEKLSANKRPILAGIFFVAVLIVVVSLYWDKVSSRSVDAYNEFQKATESSGTNEEKITKIETFLGGKHKNTDLEVKANLELSGLYVDTMQWSKAKLALEKVLSGRTSRVEEALAHLRLGEVLTFTATKDNLGDLDKAIEHFTKAQAYPELSIMKDTIAKNIENVKQQKDKLLASAKTSETKPETTKTEAKPEAEKAPAKAPDGK